MHGKNIPYLCRDAECIEGENKYYTAALHKELTPAAKRLHRSHVQSLKEKLRGYSINPFADVPARHIVTGNELDQKLIEGLLSAPEIGDERYKLFVEERLVGGRVYFYKPIRKLFLAASLEKRRQAQKTITLLKQGWRQGRDRGYSPPLEHASPPSEDEKQFFVFIVP